MKQETMTQIAQDLIKLCDIKTLKCLGCNEKEQWIYLLDDRLKVFKIHINNEKYTVHLGIGTSPILKTEVFNKISEVVDFIITHLP